jgi:hypothetical protein
VATPPSFMCEGSHCLWRGQQLGSMSACPFAPWSYFDAGLTVRAATLGSLRSLHSRASHIEP